MWPAVSHTGVLPGHGCFKYSNTYAYTDLVLSEKEQFKQCYTIRTSLGKGRGPEFTYHSLRPSSRTNVRSPTLLMAHFPTTSHASTGILSDLNLGQKKIFNGLSIYVFRNLKPVKEYTLFLSSLEHSREDNT